MCTPCVGLVSLKDKKSIWSPRSGVSDGCGLSCRCWESILDLPEGLPVIFTEPSLQPPFPPLKPGSFYVKLTVCTSHGFYHPKEETAQAGGSMQGHIGQDPELSSSPTFSSDEHGLRWTGQPNSKGVCSQT